VHQKDSLLCKSVHMIHYSPDPSEGGLYKPKHVVLYKVVQI